MLLGNMGAFFARIKGGDMKKFSVVSPIVASTDFADWIDSLGLSGDGFVMYVAGTQEGFKMLFCKIANGKVDRKFGYARRDAASEIMTGRAFASNNDGRASVGDVYGYVKVDGVSWGW